MRIRWNTTEVFSAAMLVALGIVFLMFIVFCQQYDPAVGGDTNGFSKGNATLIKMGLISPFVASAVGFRDGVARLVDVARVGAPASPPTVIRRGAFVMYAIGFSGVLTVAVFFVALRF